MNDPIRGQILVTDSLLTVTRPRQVVVHKIAETYLFGEDFKHGFFKKIILFSGIKIPHSFAIFFSKAKAFWKNAPQAPLPNV